MRTRDHFIEHADRRRSWSSKSTFLAVVFFGALWVVSYLCWAVVTAIEKRPEEHWGLVWFGVCWSIGFCIYSVIRWKQRFEARGRQLERMEGYVLRSNSNITYNEGDHSQTTHGNGVLDYDRIKDSIERLSGSRGQRGGNGEVPLMNEDGAPEFIWAGPLDDRFFDMDGRLDLSKVSRRDQERYMRFATDADRRRYQENNPSQE